MTPQQRPLLPVQLWLLLRNFFYSVLNLFLFNQVVYRRPKRIILLRHGESLGNVDEAAYSVIPDWQIPLTETGADQAKQAGHQLAELLSGESLCAYVSPYKRTLETWQHIKNELIKNDSVKIEGCQQEPRIVEQQFGNFQVKLFPSEIIFRLRFSSSSHLSMQFFL